MSWFAVVIGIFLGLSIAIVSGNTVHRKKLQNRVREKGIRFLGADGAELTVEQFVEAVFDKHEIYD